MMDRLTELRFLWVYLQATPLLGLTVTLAAYQAGAWVARLFHGHPLANPVLVAIGLLVLGLLATGTPYPVYFQGAQYIHFLLGPATVALAVPMFSNLHHIRRSLLAIVPAVLVGSVVAAGSAMLTAKLLGASRLVVLSLAAKSVTTPIAMGVAEQIGGQPSLAAVFVLMTGLIAVVVMGPVLRLVRVVEWPAQGLAGGVAGHGFATARLLLLNETAGAFSGMAIGLNGLATAVIVPMIARWIAGP